MRVYPSILTGDLVKAQAQLDECGGILEQLEAEGLDHVVVQLDVIDGQFADNLTITPIDLAGLEFGKLKADVHLMTEEPLNDVHELQSVKGRIPVRAVIAQVERMSHQADFIEGVRKEDWLPGLSLDAFTPLDAIGRDSWQNLKVVQLMSIEAGFQGQSFLPQTLDKIEELVALRRDRQLEFEIVVDGGIKEDLVSKILAMEADGVAVGTGIWDAPDKLEAYKNFAS